MVQQIRLWRVEDGNFLAEVVINDLDTEARLEDWLSGDITIIDDDLLVIGRQVRTDFGGFIDLLCMEPEGDLVIVELKRGKTPREITAQSLDYASWIVDVGQERITEIAEDFLRDSGGLEQTFREKFDSTPPETINESHRIIIVGTQIDPSTERIVQYLSEHHGVNINAVTFQFFKDTSGQEFIGRTFLLQPEEVEYKSHSRGPRRRRTKLTLEQLQNIAESNGVGTLYIEALSLLRPLFDRLGRRKAWLSLRSRHNDKWAVMLNLIPGESSTEQGLAFQAYTYRLAEKFSVTEQEIRQVMPSDVEDWEYYKDAPPDWRGVQGHFPDLDSVHEIAAVLRVT